MEDIFEPIIAIFISLIIMYIIPFGLIAERTDDISQLSSQIAVSNFTSDVVREGVLTQKRIDSLISELSSTNNVYNIELELKVMDENAIKASGVNDIQNIKYYSLYNSQIQELLDDSNGSIRLKQGDVIAATVKNRSKTLAQAIKGVFFSKQYSDISIILATSSGTVAVNGK